MVYPLGKKTSFIRVSFFGWVRFSFEFCYFFQGLSVGKQEKSTFIAGIVREGHNGRDERAKAC